MMNKLHSLRKTRRFYLFVCGVMLLSLFVETQVANSAPLGIAIETFTKIDFVNNLCWKMSVGSGNVQYTNACGFSSEIVLTHLDGITQESFTVAPKGKLIFLGGNVVHIFREEP